MKILKLAKQVDKDGVTNHMVESSLGLRKLNVEVIFGVGNGKGMDLIINNGFKVYNIDFISKNPVHIFSSFLYIIKIIKEENIDIVHCHWRSTALYMSIVSKFVDIKYIWSNHLVPIPDKGIHRVMTKYGECAIAESIEGKDFLKNNLKIPPQKIEIIRHGVNENKLQKLDLDTIKRIKHKYGIDKEFVVLLFGRLVPVKGHKVLMKAMSMTNLDYKLIFPGDGDKFYIDELNVYAKELNIENRIIYPGFVESNILLSISDLMVLPSFSEGYGLVNIESFAMKVPVIRTRTGGYNDMKNYVIGIECGDYVNLASEIIKVHENAGETKRLVEKAYSFFLNECTLDSMCDSLLILYKKVLNDVEI